MKLTYLTDDIDVVVERILSDDELKDCGLGKRKVARCLKSFQGDEIACSVFLKKYALRDNSNTILEFTLEEAKDRWARSVCAAEDLFKGKRGRFLKPSPYEYFRELYEYFFPAGRQMFALGNVHVKKATLTNCYVTKIEEDSLEGIFDAAKKLARTYSYGGGIGLCIGELRPADSKVSNSARFSTGAASFMELYSLTTGLVGQHGRRGALMITIPVGHPDVENFIEMKHNNMDMVKHANISIKLTDDFMNAVMNNEEFTLKFATHHEVIERTVKARDLWKKIVQSARDSAEPGLIFWDRMVEMSPSDTYERLQVHGTNPCGEEILEPGGTCVLSSLLLHKFVQKPFTDEACFDYDMFKKMVKRGVRHLDNVVELNMGNHGLEEQEEASRLGRRIGLGVTGLGDMYAAMGIKYDSKEALELADVIMDLKKRVEYDASIDLASERGAFPLFDPDKHFIRGFAGTLPDETVKRAKTNGLRNVAISTVAPNGSLSIIAQCSSGIEPIFALKYRRFVEMGQKKKKEFTIFHQGLARFYEAQSDEYDWATDQSDLPDYWIVSHAIDYKHRVKLQGVLQRHIDASISSTINLPKDVDIKTVGQIYVDAWKEGLKGITVYREGSREGILLTDEYAKLAGSPAMDTAIHCVRAEGGDKFYIMVSYKNKNIKEPYQVFVLNYKRSEHDSFVKMSNAVIRMLLENGVPQKRVDKYIARSNNSLAKLTRFLSLSMKTGNFEKAVDVLEEHAFVGTLAYKLYEIFSKSIAVKAMVCRNCGGSNMRMEEGCMRCLDCDWAGCA
jgi:ribonucleoside-diphosphate reductase alpha chain